MTQVRKLRTRTPPKLAHYAEAWSQAEAAAERQAEAKDAVSLAVLRAFLAHLAA